jgi:hypothetical protein
LVIWSEVKGYSGYRVSTEGGVLGKKGKPLKPYKTKDGYLEVNLSEKGVTKKFNIHRLVAETFLCNPEGLPQVNHLDGDPGNNHLQNLEWCSASRNQIHSCDVLGKNRGSKQHMARLSESDVRSILRLLANNIGVTRIAKMFSVSPVTIANIKAGSTWNWLSGKPRKSRRKRALERSDKDEASC